MEFLLSEVEIITIELWKCWSLKIDDERVGRVGIRWGRWDKKNRVSFVFLSQQAFLRLFSLHFKQTSFVWAHVKNAQASSKIFPPPNQTIHKPIFSPLFSIHPIPLPTIYTLIPVKQGHNLFFLGHLHQFLQCLCQKIY